MKTDIIQYWLEMVHVEMNIIFPLFVSLGLFRCGKEWHGLRGYKKWLEREFVFVFIEVCLLGNGGFGCFLVSLVLSFFYLGNLSTDR